MKLFFHFPASCLAALIASTVALGASRPELAVDGDFERKDTRWSIPSGGAYSLRAGAGMNGTRALYYENDSTNLPYRLPSLTIPATPGKIYFRVDPHGES